MFKHAGPRRRYAALGNTIDPIVCPPVIPPDHQDKKRTLVLCFDGTGDQFDADNSNVVQFVQLLKKDNRTKQLVYYQSGIGTYTTPEAASPFMSQIKKTLDTMFAWNLDAHIMGGYEFLMQNYIAGDRICIFGFSRGAYTARCLVGMLGKVGLLPAGDHQQIPFAYKIYMCADRIGWEQSVEFKMAFSVDVPIEFVGVWDTVGSVNTPVPFTTSNNIRTFRHALSLDERHAKFKTNVWIKHANTEESKLGPDSTITSEASPPSPVKVGSATSPASRPSAESFDDLASLGNYSEKGLTMKDVLHGNEKNDKEGKKQNNNDHTEVCKKNEGDPEVLRHESFNEF